jgi:hypothetical protein
MKTSQLRIDFSTPKFLIDDEKKDQLISFRVGEKLKTDLELIMKAKGVDTLSKLCQEYVIAGFLSDYKSLLLIQANGSTTLQELLRQ